MPIYTRLNLEDINPKNPQKESVCSIKLSSIMSKHQKTNASLLVKRRNKKSKNSDSLSRPQQINAK
jgi:hypothetical protein